MEKCKNFVVMKMYETDKLINEGFILYCIVQSGTGSHRPVLVIRLKMPKLTLFKKIPMHTKSR